jgi:hypothetical protein
MPAGLHKMCTEPGCPHRQCHEYQWYAHKARCAAQIFMGALTRTAAISAEAWSNAGSAGPLPHGAQGQRAVTTVLIGAVMSAQNLCEGVTGAPAAEQVVMGAPDPAAETAIGVVCKLAAQMRAGGEVSETMIADGGGYQPVAAAAAATLLALAATIFGCLNGEELVEMMTDAVEGKLSALVYETGE